MTTDGSEEAIDCVVNLITSVACISHDHLQSDDPTEARTSKRVMGQKTAVSRRQRDDSDRVDRSALDASAEAVSTTKEDIKQFTELRLYASPFETRKVGDQVAEFFAGQRVGETRWHGGAFVDSVFDCLDGNLADFASGEIAQADRVNIF